MSIYSWPDFRSTLVDVCRRLNEPDAGRRFSRQWNALEILWKRLHNSGTGTTGPGAFQACNCDYPDRKPGHYDGDLLQALIQKGSGVLFGLCNSVAVKDLCDFDPLIEDESVKRKIRNLETELERLRGDSQDLQEQIDEKERERERLVDSLKSDHKKAAEAFKDYQDIMNGNTSVKLTNAVCRLVKLIRNNESHHGKTTSGRNREDPRNRKIFELAVGVFDVFFEGLLENPDQRLARPVFGVVNDSVDEVIAGIKVERRTGRAEAVKRNGGKEFSWEPGLDPGCVLDVEVLESDQLPKVWSKIDDWYGQRYRRIWVPVSIDGQDTICSFYEIDR
jgi:hypothetical protein